MASWHLATLVATTLLAAIFCAAADATGNSKTFRVCYGPLAPHARPCLWISDSPQASQIHTLLCLRHACAPCVHIFPRMHTHAILVAASTYRTQATICLHTLMHTVCVCRSPAAGLPCSVPGQQYTFSLAVHDGTHSLDGRALGMHAFRVTLKLALDLDVG